MESVSAPSPRDYYDVLGLPKTATTQEIIAKYRNLARHAHPDKHGDENDFIVITKAYKVLKDPDARKLYDLHGPSLGKVKLTQEKIERIRFGGPFFETLVGNFPKLTLTEAKFEPLAPSDVANLALNLKTRLAPYVENGNAEAFRRANNTFVAEVKRELFGADLLSVIGQCYTICSNEIRNSYLGKLRMYFKGKGHHLNQRVDLVRQEAVCRSIREEILALQKVDDSDEEVLDKLENRLAAETVTLFWHWVKPGIESNMQKICEQLFLEIPGHNRNQWAEALGLLGEIYHN